jgi:hypothetical protein
VQIFDDKIVKLLIVSQIISAVKIPMFQSVIDLVIFNSCSLQQLTPHTYNYLLQDSNSDILNAVLSQVEQGSNCEK